MIWLFQLLFSSAAMAVGFSAGDQFVAVPLMGDVTVQCNPVGQIPTVARFQCRDNVLEPVPSDFFIGPEGVDADSFNLTANLEDGTVRTRKGRYLPNKGRSDNRVNLWLVSLLQRPLLDYGKNTIEYSLTKKGQVVAKGSFTVKVSPSDVLTCESRIYQSTDENDCRNSFNACTKYFSLNPICR